MGRIVKIVFMLPMLLLAMSTVMASGTGEASPVTGFLLKTLPHVKPLLVKQRLLEIPGHLCPGEGENVPLSITLPRDTREIRLYDINRARPLVFRIVPGEKALVRYQTRIRLPTSTTLVFIAKIENLWFYEAHTIRVAMCCSPGG